MATPPQSRQDPAWVRWVPLFVCLCAYTAVCVWVRLNAFVCLCLGGSWGQKTCQPAASFRVAACMPARQRLDTILPPPILHPAPKLPVAASLMLCMQLYYWVDALSNGTKAAVGGTCPTVGTGGLIQGGGIGFLTRQHGLACDQVEEIHMVSPASCPV